MSSTIDPLQYLGRPLFGPEISPFRLEVSSPLYSLCRLGRAPRQVPSVTGVEDSDVFSTALGRVKQSQLVEIDFYHEHATSSILTSSFAFTG
jgi:hypothetical protein